MAIDFTNLTGAQAAVLTAVATLIAAVTAGSFALVVALVNASAARRIARSHSYRDYKVQLYKPFIDALDREMVLIREVLFTGAGMDARKKPSVTEGLAALSDLAKRPRASQAFGLFTPGLFGTTGADGSLGRLRVVEAEIDEAMRDLRLFLESKGKREEPADGWPKLEGVHQLRLAYELALANYLVAGYYARVDIEKDIFSERSSSFRAYRTLCKTPASRPAEKGIQ